MEKLTDAQRKLVEDNINLVHWVMHNYFKSYYPGSYDYEDLSQQGMLMLCRAARSFDESKGCKFSTYASQFIWGGINHYKNGPFSSCIHHREGYGPTIPEIASSLNDVISDDNGHSVEILYTLASISHLQYDKSDSYISAKEAFAKASKRHGKRLFELLLLENTQAQCAEVLGVRQAQVSRIIKKANDIYNEY